MPNYDLIWQSIQIRWILKVTLSAETLPRNGFCNYIKIDNKFDFNCYYNFKKDYMSLKASQH